MREAVREAAVGEQLGRSGSAQPEVVELGDPAGIDDRDREDGQARHPGLARGQGRPSQGDARAAPLSPRRHDPHDSALACARIEQVQFADAHGNDGARGAFDVEGSPVGHAGAKRDPLRQGQNAVHIGARSRP